MLFMQGVLLDGTVIAVKQLSSKSKQGNQEFVNEMGIVSGLQHPNLVRLYGCCVEKNELLLVYEYMENNSLGNALFGKGLASLSKLQSVPVQLQLEIISERHSKKREKVNGWYYCITGPLRQMKLDWPTRQNICVGIAKGLAFLHEESRLRIVHRDIKLTNVLLDEKRNAKISDFGLAKLDEVEKTHISTRVAGTM